MKLSFKAGIVLAVGVAALLTTGLVPAVGQHPGPEYDQPTQQSQPDSSTERNYSTGSKYPNLEPKIDFSKMAPDSGRQMPTWGLGAPSSPAYDPFNSDKSLGVGIDEALEGAAEREKDLAEGVGALLPAELAAKKIVGKGAVVLLGTVADLSRDLLTNPSTLNESPDWDPMPDLLGLYLQHHDPYGGSVPNSPDPVGPYGPVAPSGSLGGSCPSTSGGSSNRCGSCPPGGCWTGPKAAAPTSPKSAALSPPTHKPGPAAPSGPPSVKAPSSIKPTGSSNSNQLKTGSGNSNQIKKSHIANQGPVTRHTTSTTAVPKVHATPVHSSTAAVPTDASKGVVPAHGGAGLPGGQGAGGPMGGRGPGGMLGGRGPGGMLGGHGPGGMLGGHGPGALGGHGSGHMPVFHR
jgi:hypothetical protein